MGGKIGSGNIPADKCNAVYDAVCMGVSVNDVAKYFEMPRSTASNTTFKLLSEPCWFNGAAYPRVN